MFKNPFSFQERIRRTEYGLSYIMYVIIIFSFNLAVQDTGVFGSIIFMVVYIGLLWFFLAQGAKRCHDLGNSGVYQLIPFYFFMAPICRRKTWSKQIRIKSKNIG